MYQYKVIPFIGSIKGEKVTPDNAKNVSNDLEKVINEYARQGWEFYEIDKVDIATSPGCMTAFLGGKSSVITFDQLIFRKQM